MESLPYFFIDVLDENCKRWYTFIWKSSLFSKEERKRKLEEAKNKTIFCYAEVFCIEVGYPLEVCLHDFVVAIWNMLKMLKILQIISEISYKCEIFYDNKNVNLTMDYIVVRGSTLLYLHSPTNVTSSFCICIKVNTYKQNLNFRTTSINV